MSVSATIDVYIRQGYVSHATTQFYSQQPHTATKDVYIHFEYGYFLLSVVAHVDSFGRWYVVFSILNKKKSVFK